MDGAPRHDWDGFFALYRALAIRVATGLLGDPTAAEDVVQEAARALVERDEDFESREHARNWFLRAVRNLATSDLRARGRARRGGEADETLADARAVDPAADAAEREARDALGEGLNAALDALDPTERDAILLRYRDGLAYREIAARTGKAISTLQARVEAGLRKIRSRLGKHLDGSNEGGEDV